VDGVDRLDVGVGVDRGLDDRRGDRPGGRFLAVDVLAGVDDAGRGGVSAQEDLQQLRQRAGRRSAAWREPAPDATMTGQRPSLTTSKRPRDRRCRGYGA
jgi:hypothetical protein